MDTHTEIMNTTIQIPSLDILKQNNIDSYIQYFLKKNYESCCSQFGFILKNSLKLLKRSVGKCITIDNISKIEYKVTFQINTLSPCKGDIYDCTIDSITKMGIVGYFQHKDLNQEEITLKNSPIIFIVPNDFIKDIDYKSDKSSIKVEILESRIKYKSLQIQVVAKEV